MLESEEAASEVKNKSQMYLHSRPGLDVSLFLGSSVKKFYYKICNDFPKASF